MTRNEECGNPDWILVPLWALDPNFTITPAVAGADVT